MNIKRLFNIKKRNLFYALLAFLILVLSLPFVERQAHQPSKDVVDFANQIIKDYAKKNDYSGLRQTYNELQAGNEKGDMLGFGSKGFYIVAKNIDEDKCQSLLLGSMAENISLISVNVNEVEYNWGNGLPLDYKKIEEVCNPENNIIWQY